MLWNRFTITNYRSLLNIHTVNLLPTSQSLLVSKMYSNIHVRILTLVNKFANSVLATSLHLSTDHVKFSFIPSSTKKLYTLYILTYLFWMVARTVHSYFNVDQSEFAMYYMLTTITSFNIIVASCEFQNPGECCNGINQLYKYISEFGGKHIKPFFIT